MSPRTFLARFRTRTKVLSAAGVVVVAAAAVWVFAFLLPAQNAKAETITRTASASLETLEKTVQGTGTATPAVQDDVSFTVSGTVTAVKVAEGQTVAAGDVLATVDTLELNADLLAAKATLADAKSSLADAQDSDASDARISAASAAVDVAQADVESATDALSDATLKAPAAGLVTGVGIAVGDRITGSGSSSSSSSSSAASSTSGGGSPFGGAESSSSSDSSTSSAAFTIVSTDAWSLDVSVGETDIANVKKGQQVELTTDDGDEYFGVVAEVGALPSTTSGSAQYPVSVTVTGDGKGLYDGVSLSAAIVYERRTDVLSVPSAAVTTSDGKSTVTVVADDGTQTEKTVEVGETADSYTEITSGLAEGDKVVVSSFTPGEGNSGQFPGSGQMPGGGEMPGGGQMPGSGQMPGGGEFPGGGNGGQR